MNNTVKQLKSALRRPVGAIVLCFCFGGGHPAAQEAAIAAPSVRYEAGAQAPDHSLFYGKSRLNALTFKVNAVGVGLLQLNTTFELEWRQWSVQLPVYYSNLDYFSHRVKFRTMALQPGVRYWFTPEADSGHRGWFVGAHFGMAWYNVALGGTDRIQDHKGRTPALGGGIEGGWRRTLGRTGRWKLELSIGVGAYKARYDHIDNHDGTLLRYSKRTFVGIDHVGVSFCYSLDLKKGGMKP
ncbi:MAG: DUF3575 domain-containing protein [Muribaculaceae bacterium]|nr:DUF3575 domain-containing protein [Muribaculaceae bacterium]